MGAGVEASSAAIGDPNGPVAGASVLRCSLRPFDRLIPAAGGTPSRPARNHKEGAKPIARQMAVRF